MHADLLFQPITLGSIACSNRVVMAPMTRNRAGPGRVPRALNVLYYTQRASAGLMVTEATQISPQGVGYDHTPGIHTSGQIEGWRQVTQSVHAAGGRVVLQLWHVGRISHASFQPGGNKPVAPSPIRPAGQVYTAHGALPYDTPHELSIEQIQTVVRDYAQATLHARAAGFDGVEIHAANGYLIDQFLRDGSNQRRDGYGGSAAQRCRFLSEVTQSVCHAWRADRVGVRISPVNGFNDMHDSNPQALFETVAAALNDFGLAYLHVTESGADRIAFDFTRLRRAFRGPYVAAGGYTRARAVQALRAGDADMIAFATLFLANPDLPERLARDAALNLPDRKTFYGGDARGYTDYPTLS